jgi:hypothetical protein
MCVLFAALWSAPVFAGCGGCGGHEDHGAKGDMAEKKVCSCAAGKKGENVWCKACGKGYVEGEVVKCKGCFKAATEGGECEMCAAKE